MKVNWSQKVVDLGKLQTGLGVAWVDSGALLGLSLNPDRNAAKKSLQLTSSTKQLIDSPLPEDLNDQLEDALWGREIEWTWPPMLEIGTSFQRTVWAELLKCPHGQCWSYSELARRLGNPGAARAVGSA